MKTLFVLLPPAPLTSRSAWAYLESPDGRQAGRFASATSASLPRPRGWDAQVVLVVPAAALSWHALTWPRGLAEGSARLRAALEGLLEEQLLDEPQALHFAIEPGARADATAWVAVMDREWLVSALALLEGQGLAVTRIVPELPPMPRSQTQVQVHALAREGDAAHGQVIVSSAQGVQVLPMTPDALPLLPPLDDDTLCYAEPAVAAHAESLLERPMLLQPTPQRWLAASGTGWDLAQFDLAQTRQRRAARQVARAWDLAASAASWRPVRWGLLALALVQVAGLQAWAWRERAALRQQQDSLALLLRQTFPQVRTVADAPAQMDRAVRQLRRATGETTAGDLEPLLSALALAAPQTRPMQIDFQEGELRVRGLSVHAGALESALRARGLDAVREGDGWRLRPRDPA